MQSLAVRTQIYLLGLWNAGGPNRRRLGVPSRFRIASRSRSASASMTSGGASLRTWSRRSRFSRLVSKISSKLLSDPWYDASEHPSGGARLNTNIHPKTTQRKVLKSFLDPFLKTFRKALLRVCLRACSRTQGLVQLSVRAVFSILAQIVPRTVRWVMHRVGGYRQDKVGFVIPPWMADHNRQASVVTLPLLDLPPLLRASPETPKASIEAKK
jgi:hypothetical protein